jgi:hypothetical protein
MNQDETQEEEKVIEIGEKENQETVMKYSREQILQCRVR